MINAFMKNPIFVFTVVMLIASLGALLIGIPVSKVTEIALYTLYGAGVNLLVAYVGLVPFGASVFFGCASYAAAFVVLGRYGNDLVSLLFATGLSAVLALVIGAIILRRK